MGDTPRESVVQDVREAELRAAAEAYARALGLTPRSLVLIASDGKSDREVVLAWDSRGRSVSDPVARRALAALRRSADPLGSRALAARAGSPYNSHFRATLRKLLEDGDVVRLRRKYALPPDSST